MLALIPKDKLKELCGCNDNLGYANEEGFVLFCIPQTKEEAELLSIMQDVITEVHHGDTKYPHDPMEKDDIPAAFGTVECEVGELRKEVNRKKQRPEALHKEAIQVAAMGIKFIRDICL